MGACPLPADGLDPHDAHQHQGRLFAREGGLRPNGVPIRAAHCAAGKIQIIYFSCFPGKT